MMEPGAVQEPFGVALQMSGTDIIDAICNEIAASLSRSCDLRATDAYRSFGGTIKISLQLVDLDVTGIEQESAIGGKMDPLAAVEQIEVTVPGGKRGYVSRVRSTK